MARKQVDAIPHFAVCEGTAVIIRQGALVYAGPVGDLPLELASGGCLLLNEIDVAKFERYMADLNGDRIDN